MTAPRVGSGDLFGSGLIGLECGPRIIGKPSVKTPLISLSFAVAASENFRSSEKQLLEAAPTPRAPRLRIEILPWNTPDITFDGMSRSRVIESQLSDSHVQSCRTSKMSHDRGWRAACLGTTWIPEFHFEIREVARGVTAMVVGSGALLGLFTPVERVRISSRA